jgi:hypothetical protein
VIQKHATEEFVLPKLLPKTSSSLLGDCKRNGEADAVSPFFFCQDCRFLQFLLYTLWHALHGRYAILESALLFAGMAELADAADSKSAGPRGHGGSTPPPGTNDFTSAVR